MKTEMYRPLLNKGQSVIILLSILPFLISLFVLFYTIGKIHLIHSKQLHTCRYTSLKQYDLASKFLNQLLSLNPIAKSLETKLKIAKASASVANAAGPIGIAAGQAAIKAVELKQYALRMKQEYLIGAFHKSIHKTKSDTSIELNKSNISKFKVDSSQIKFNRSPPYSIAPEVHTPLNFDRMSRIQFRWLLKTTSTLIPKQLSQIPFKKEISFQCSIHFVQQNSKKWVAALDKDRL